MLSVDGFSERPVSGATKKTSLDAAAVCLDDEDDFAAAVDGSKSPTRGGVAPRKWSGKAVAGGLLLMPKLRVSSRRRRQRRQGTTKNSANEVSRSNSFKFERYQAAVSPEGAEADSAGRADGTLQREVGRRRGVDMYIFAFGHFTIC